MNQMMGAPPQQMQQQPMAAPTAEQIAQAHDHLEIIIGGLLKLISKPSGSLTKEDVFKAAADMIAKGCFPDAAHKQQLVQVLVQLPDQEGALRSALGHLLMQYASMQEQMVARHGPRAAGGPNAG